MNDCDLLEKKIRHICQNEYKYFISKENVIGVGLGYKIVNGFNTLKKCIKVFVTKKYSVYNNNKNLVPPTYKGIITDIEERTIPVVTSLTKRIRPVVGGYNIGPVNEPIGGTMGCVVTDNHNNFILSNNHLLANGNLLPIGTSILQPSMVYGGHSPKDTVAGLSEYIPVKEGTGNNFVDCAIARILNKKNVSPELAVIGPIKGVASAKLGDNVKKVGSTTEFTLGKVTTINTMMFAMFNGVLTGFQNQILTTRMTEKGDSGSLLVNSYNYAIGLMMSQNTTDSIFNNLPTVLKSLNVLLVKH